MDRIIAIILYIAIYQSSFSQTNRIVYRAEFNFSKTENALNKVPEKIKKKIEKIKKNNDDIYCFLDFDKSKSVFYVDNTMESGRKRKMNITKVKIGKGIFFIDNTKSEIVNQKNSFDKDFEVIYPNNKWNVTQETKKIGKYICYKATTEIKREGRWGKKSIPVTAWFTTDLPYRFGPKQYSGLPGMILELTEGDLTFYAQKIKLNQIGLKLKEKNQKGNKVTLVEFNETIKKMFNNR